MVCAFYGLNANQMEPEMNHKTKALIAIVSLYRKYLGGLSPGVSWLLAKPIVPTQPALHTPSLSASSIRLFA